VPFYSQVPDTLRGLYGQYCEREAMALLGLLPETERRGFARRARVWAEGEGLWDPTDPLAAARRYARSLLPLPPYELWIRSYLADRWAYLDRLGVPSLPRTGEPVAVALRDCPDGWMVTLSVTGSELGWRAFLEFHREGEEGRWRTAEIFRGDDPDEFRQRFLEFNPATLQAFLRSILP